MDENTPRRDAFQWQDDSRRDDHRLQLLLLESLSCLQDISQQLDRAGWLPDGIDRDELKKFQHDALEFLLNLDPLELGDTPDAGSPVPGQMSLFDRPDSREP